MKGGGVGGEENISKSQKEMSMVNGECVRKSIVERSKPLVREEELLTVLSTSCIVSLSMTVGNSKKLILIVSTDMFVSLTRHGYIVIFSNSWSTSPLTYLSQKEATKTCEQRK